MSPSSSEVTSARDSMGKVWPSKKLWSSASRPPVRATPHQHPEYRSGDTMRGGDSKGICSEPLRTLEALLDEEGEAHTRGPRLPHDVEQGHGRRARRQEVVHHQHAVGRRQELRRHCNTVMVIIISAPGDQRSDWSHKGAGRSPTTYQRARRRSHACATCSCPVGHQRDDSVGNALSSFQASR